MKAVIDGRLETANPPTVVVAPIEPGA